jgi:DNA-binding GntR family transcriptional regulator
VTLVGADPYEQLRAAIVDRLVGTLNSDLVRFQYRTILVRGRAERSFAEHTAIVEAVCAGDPDAAEVALRRHLGAATDALRESVAYIREP